MAALSVTNPSLLDVTKATDPNGNIAKVAEILALETPIIENCVFIEGNLPTGHRGNIRADIPEPTWRKYNAGVQPTKSRTAVVTANTGMLEDYSEVDKALADLAGNAQAYRLSQDKAKIQGFSHKLARYFIYGNEGSEPEAITGLTPHYNTFSSSAGSSENVINGAGTGTDNGSIWLINFREDGIHGIYPKGSRAGLQQNDKGQVTIENADGAGGRMEAYRTHYRWDAGLFVADWRFAVRICNIDKSNLVKDASSGADLPDLMYQALEHIKDTSGGRVGFYMSRTMRSMARRQATNATRNSTLTVENVGGRMIESFHGIPMHRLDCLAADETLVV